MQLTDDGFAALFEEQPAGLEQGAGQQQGGSTFRQGLCVLDIGHCRQLSNRSIGAAARCCGATLQHLDVRGLSGLSDMAMVEVGANCAALLTLSAQRCAKLSDASIIALAEGCSVLGVINVMGCRNIDSRWAFHYIKENTLACNIRFVDA